MKLTSKGRYAVMAMADLANVKEKRTTNLTEISLRQGISQAQLSADQQAAQTEAFEAQQRLQQYGAGLGQLAGFGAVAPQLPTGAETSALDKALGTALGVGGLYAKIFARPQIVVR